MRRRMFGVLRRTWPEITFDDGEFLIDPLLRVVEIFLVVISHENPRQSRENSADGEVNDERCFDIDLSVRRIGPFEHRNREEYLKRD